jgi:hypothetical protein
LLIFIIVIQVACGGMIWKLPQIFTGCGMNRMEEMTVVMSGRRRHDSMIRSFVKHDENGYMDDEQRSVDAVWKKMMLVVGGVRQFFVGRWGLLVR